MSSAATRETLLEAAWRLFRQDPESASMASVAVEAGVSRQAVYLHFQSRAGLLLALVQWIDDREGIAERIAKARSGKASRESLDAAVRVWLDYLPRLHPVALFLARSTGDAEARAAWSDRMSELERVYRASLRELHKTGALAPGLSVDDATALVRAIASVDAWHFLVNEKKWKQADAVDSLMNAVGGALYRPSC